MAEATSFLDLSNDVLLLLFDILSDSALAAFSRTCRNINEMAKPPLEVRKLCTEFEEVIIDDDEDDPTPKWYHPVDILLQIDATPRIASVVTCIRLLNPMGQENYDSATKVRGIKAKTEKYPHFKKLLNRFDFLDDKQRELYLDALRNANPLPALLLLLSICPNVVELELSQGFNMNTFLVPVIAHLQGQRALFFTQQSTFAKSFPRISKLKIGHWVQDWGVGLGTIGSLLLLPGLRKLEARLLGYEMESKFAWPEGVEASSTIQEVDNDLCEFSPKDMKLFLGGVPELVSMNHADIYDFNTGGWEDDDGEEVRWDSQDDFNTQLCEMLGSMLIDRGWSMVFDDKLEIRKLPLPA